MHEPSSEQRELVAVQALPLVQAAGMGVFEFSPAV
jgi:hypothetical protein